MDEQAEAAVSWMGLGEQRVQKGVGAELQQAEAGSGPGRDSVWRLPEAAEGAGVVLLSASPPALACLSAYLNLLPSSCFTPNQLPPPLDRHPRGKPQHHPSTLFDG
jgi:hypothetical protein